MVIETARVTSLCATLLCSCVWCFYSIDVFVHLVHGGCAWDGCDFSVSSHNIVCVFPMCVHESLEKGMSGATHSLKHPGAACVHLTLCMYETVFDL